MESLPLHVQELLLTCICFLFKHCLNGSNIVQRWELDLGFTLTLNWHFFALHVHRFSDVNLSCVTKSRTFLT